MSWSLDCDCFLDDNEVSARSSRNSKDHLPLTDWVVGGTWQTIQGWGRGSVGQTWSIGPSRRCRRFHSPVRQEIFLPESTFSEDFLTYVRTPPCAIACINICAHVKDPVVHGRVRWIVKTLKTPSKHSRLGSATLSLLAFPEESNPNFPWEKSH